jgi:F-type H+-transporting ATPase subunit gamma
MPSLKAIRKRIGSIRNTQQITKAMKMVSAAKLRRAQEAVLGARPYAEKMVALLQNLSRRVSGAAHPLLQARDGNRIDLILITADRGLCGGYNANLIRAAERFMRANAGQKTISLILVGRKGMDYFRRRRIEAVERVQAGATQSASLAAELGQKVVNRFLAEETDETYILYSQFRSALSQVPTLEKLLPVAGAGEQSDVEAVEYLFEPGIQELLSSLLPKIVEVGIYRALLEAAASEHGARMTAMDSATSNAAEIMGRLTLQMNRARQAVITKELLEIVSTAEALK